MVKELIIGYYGMSNTGSEIRLKVLVDELNHLPVKSNIFVGHEKLYKEEKLPHVKHIDYGVKESLNPFTLLSIVKRYDMIIIAEGIPFANFFGKGFLIGFIPIMLLAKLFGKRVIYYACDIDKLTRIEDKILRKTLKYADMLILRSKGSFNRAKRLGLDRVRLTADPAHLFSDTKLPENLRKKKTRLGISLINIFAMPITLKLFGDKEDCYRYPYFYAYRYGKGRYNRFVEHMAQLLDKLSKDMEIVILIMDDLVDSRINTEVYENTSKKNIKLVNAKDHTLEEINGVISTFDFVISSRLHVLILSLRFSTPMIALRCDERFDYFLDEIGMQDYTLKYPHNRLIDDIQSLLRKVIRNQTDIRKKLQIAFRRLEKRSKSNKDLLKELLNDYI